ncbi:MAG: polysaccharide deacetylase family protein [Vulcanimicrobiaceae bacterium]
MTRALVTIGMVGVAVATAAISRGVHTFRSPQVMPIITPTMNAEAAIMPKFGERVVRIFESHMPGVRRPRLIALTFDDGPYPVETPLLLDQLRALDVHATFFLIGRDATQFPELTTRIERDGNEIANHTLTHPELDHLSPQAVERELSLGAEALERIVDDPSIQREMRPPHGRFTAATIEIAQRAGYDVILWTEDPGDWRTVSPAALASRVIEHATAPDIVLLHSGRMATIQMLPQVVARFRRAGYTFVTVRELMARVPMDEIDRPIHVAI